jgi:mannose-6-phosphate isomerase-like protein (cupin superfamily)
VQAGDVVMIPAGMAQRITNTGDDDLVFYCLCTPHFHTRCYQRRTDLEDYVEGSI